MLNRLCIQQFALIDYSEIAFGAGFNVISGETGAGKSILIDAIALLLGERAQAAMIRPHADTAEICAQFDALPEAAQTLLTAEQKTPSCVIRRSIREKSGKIWINEQKSTAQFLKTFTPALVTIHGQHKNQALLKADEQRARLDDFGQLTLEKNAVRAAWQHWQTQQKRYQEAQAQQRDFMQRQEWLRYQLAQFDELAVQENEFMQLSQEHHRLSYADELLSKGAQLSQMLYEDAASVDFSLHRSGQMMVQLAEKCSDFQEAADLLQQSLIYLREAYDSFATQLRHIELDPERLAAIDERMAALHGAAKKYRITPEQLYDYEQQLRRELEQIENHALQEAQLAEQCALAADDYHRCAARLSDARKTVAPQLAAAMMHWLHQLGMENATFHIDVLSGKASSFGQDEVHFLLSANLGHPLQPLAKVASGGELARISLAIETTCFNAQSVPTVIFDEIDSGIGGEVADTVGRLLHTLSKHCQVLCVTHLPQVAAWADHHFAIEKFTTENETKTLIRALDEQQRIIEIARMLGDASSPISKQHACALLQQHASGSLQ